MTMSDFKQVRVQQLDPLGEAGLGLREPGGPRGPAWGAACPALTDALPTQRRSWRPAAPEAPSATRHSSRPPEQAALQVEQGGTEEGQVLLGSRVLGTRRSGVRALGSWQAEAQTWRLESGLLGPGKVEAETWTPGSVDEARARLSLGQAEAGTLVC